MLIVAAVSDNKHFIFGVDSHRSAEKSAGVAELLRKSKGLEDDVVSVGKSTNPTTVVSFTVSFTSPLLSEQDPTESATAKPAATGKCQILRRTASR